MTRWGVPADEARYCARWGPDNLCAEPDALARYLVTLACTADPAHTQAAYWRMRLCAAHTAAVCAEGLPGVRCWMAYTDDPADHCEGVYAVSQVVSLPV